MKLIYQNELNNYCNKSGRFRSDILIKETRGYNIENVEFLDGLGEFQYRDPFSEVSEVPESIKIYISELAKYL